MPVPDIDAAHTSIALPPHGHETVIKFVLSGPILADRSVSAEVARAQPSDELAELRARVERLERALADTGARLDALAFSTAIPAPRSLPAAEPEPERAALAVAAELVDDDEGWTSTPPPALFGELPAGVTAVAEPVALAAAPAPKVRGLRRMISVLKHD